MKSHHHQTDENQREGRISSKCSRRKKDIGKPQRMKDDFLKTVKDHGIAILTVSLFTVTS